MLKKLYRWFAALQDPEHCSVTMILASVSIDEGVAELMRALGPEYCITSAPSLKSRGHIVNQSISGERWEVSVWQRGCFFIAATFNDWQVMESDNEDAIKILNKIIEIGKRSVDSGAVGSVRISIRGWSADVKEKLAENHEWLQIDKPTEIGWKWFYYIESKSRICDRAEMLRLYRLVAQHVLATEVIPKPESTEEWRLILIECDRILEGGRYE